MTTIDTETTGRDHATAHIIDVAMLCRGEVKEWRVKPPVAIDPEASAIHGIYDTDVADAPPFAAVAREIAAAIETAEVLVGFNIKAYDVPLISRHFDEAGVSCRFPLLLDVSVLDKIARPRTLSAALEYWCSKKHNGAHGALADCIATEEVLSSMMTWHWKTETLDDLGELARRGVKAADPAGKLRWDGDTLVFAFGMHIGKPVTAEPTYVAWMYKTNFPKSTMAMIEEYRRR